MDLWQALMDYGHAVLPYWWGILVGIIMPFFDVLKWHGKEWKVPGWARTGIAVVAVFLAQFLAYRDCLRNVNVFAEEKALAIGERDKLGAEIARVRASLEQKDTVIFSQQALLNKEFSVLPSRVLSSAATKPSVVWHYVNRGATRDPEGTLATEFLIYPSQRVSSPVRLELVFTQKMVRPPRISVTGLVGMSQLGPWAASPNTFTFTVIAPALQPETQAVVTAYSREQEEIVTIKCQTCAD